MATESIYALRRPGFPKEAFDDSTYTTTIEYIGLDSTLRVASPAKGTVWGEYYGVVTAEDIDPLPGTSYSVLTVVCARKFDTSGGGTGTKQTNETTYEIDWADVQRSMFEHPKFAEGGANVLSVEDKAQIESWKKMDRADYKAQYFYYTTTQEAGITATLSANAQLFAKGILLGVEYFIEKVPVARRSDTYVNGPPPAGTSGRKEIPTGFPNLPNGYEWIRDADRALRAGGQNAWTNDTTWLGAKKVLVDVANIYWTV
jgi:hypothetical protein